jgi:hypothetical protein
MVGRNLCIDEISSWLLRQDCSWQKATFLIEGRRSLPFNVMSKHVKNTMNFASQHIYGNEFRRHKRQLRRLVVPGGNLEVGVFNHFHLLVEQPLHLPPWQLQEALTRGWNVFANRGLQQHFGDVTKFKPSVWMQPLSGSPDAYLTYITRFEGADLSAGTEKIDWVSTHLN